jgi:hypothetical protein
MKLCLWKSNGGFLPLVSMVSPVPVIGGSGDGPLGRETRAGAAGSYYTVSERPVILMLMERIRAMVGDEHQAARRPEGHEHP